MDTSDENLAKLFKMYSRIVKAVYLGTAEEKSYAINAELPQLRNSTSVGLQNLLGLDNLEANLKGVFPDPY